MATALVLGATGHIGAHIVRALLAEGHTVRAGYRRDTHLSVLEGLPVQRVRVDVMSGAGLSQALAGCDWVFHAAGYYPRFTERSARAVSVGVESTRRLFEAFRAAQMARIVFTSSAATVERAPALPPRTGWHALYARVKTAMEREALQAARAGLPIIVTNPSICLGEYDAHPFSGQLILAYAKYRLPFYLAREVNVVYTGDVGLAHVRAAERGRVGQRYILNAHDLSLREFAACVARVAQVPAPRWRIPAWLSPPHEGQRLDSSPAVTELGMVWTPVEEAIRRALQWFRAHGYVKNGDTH